MMLANVVNRSLSSTIARAPSIRFRYGASRDQQKVTTSASSTPAATGGTKSTPSEPGEAIYDFQIPQRWRRRPLSEEEIAYINRGGPE